MKFKHIREITKGYEKKIAELEKKLTQIKHVTNHQIDIERKLEIIEEIATESKQ